MVSKRFVRFFNIYNSISNAHQEVDYEPPHLLLGKTQSVKDFETKQQWSEGFHNDFLDFGKVGKITQVFGRKGGIIPDGLCGTNEVYNEQ